MSYQRVKAVLFDVDGTLADTDVYHRQVFADLLKPYGIDCDREFYDTHISGKANSVLAKELLPQLPEEEGTAVFFISIGKEELFRELAEDQLHPLPGLNELLAHLRTHHILTAAVTNAPKPNVVMILGILGLASPEHPIGPSGCKGKVGGFNTVVLGEECKRVKPAPDAYLLAMERLNVKPNECIVFEDSESGIKAGVSAGVPTIGVLTTKTQQQMEALNVYGCINDYRDIDFEAFLTGENFFKKKDLLNSNYKGN